MQQEEQLRALKLEREFQRRAEECARQEEEEEGEEDQVRVMTPWAFVVALEHSVSM
jgi:hypothetical protein